MAGEVRRRIIMRRRAGMKAAAGRRNDAVGTRGRKDGGSDENESAADGGPLAGLEHGSLRGKGAPYVECRSDAVVYAG